MCRGHNIPYQKNIFVLFLESIQIAIVSFLKVITILAIATYPKVRNRKLHQCSFNLDFIFYSKLILKFKEGCNLEF